MADEIDRANDRVADAERDGIAHARRALQTRALAPCGACHWCNEPLANPQQVFCDAVCAEALAAQQKRERGRAC